MRKTLIRTVVAVVLAGLVLAPVVAEEPDKSDDKKPEAKREPDTRTSEERARDVARSTVITNDVLSDLYGPGRARPDNAVVRSEGEAAAEGAAGQAEAVAQAAPPDPVKAMQERLAREKQQKIQVEDARAKVAELEQKVADLEKRALAIANPLLPRPKIPEELQEEWSSMGSVQRLDATRQEIEQAKADLEAARKEVSRLERGS